MNLASSQFSMPQMNYSPLDHTASHGNMYAGLLTYQPDNSTSFGIPTQASYPPSYNSYFGSPHSFYVGPAGSSLYNAQSLIQSPYSMHTNMLNCMAYANNKHHHNSSSLLSYNTQLAYPYSARAIGGVGVVPGSSTSATMGGYSSFPVIAICSQGLRHDSYYSSPNTSSMSTSFLSPTHSNISTRVGPINTQVKELVLSNDKGHSRSPWEKGNPLDKVVQCNSTTAGQESSAESSEVNNHAGAEHKNRVVELQHYTSRYIHVHKCLC